MKILFGLKKYFNIRTENSAMKKFSILTLISMLLFISCRDNQQITSPVNSNDIITEYVSGNDSLMQEQQDAIDLPEPDWITMPLQKSPAQSSTFFASKWIYNNLSDDITIDTFYLGGIFDTVKIKLKLKFDNGILQADSLFVTMEVDIENSTVKFGPPAVFNAPARLDYKIKGLDFSVNDPYSMQFVFAGDDGSIEPINYFLFDIKESDGSIQMWKGEIHHFSRYGFVK